MSAPGETTLDLSLARYGSKGALRFLLHFVGGRAWSHLAVLLAVLAAVGCSVGSQYAIKKLVDVLGSGRTESAPVWPAVWLLVGLIAGDNLLWRVAGFISTYAFVAVGGDLRLALFDHVSQHSPRYFADSFPGAVAGRVATAANAVWSIENSLVWSTIPPCVAVIASVCVLATVSWKITVTLLVIVAVLGTIIARFATNGRQLHERFANRAAAVSGDLTDIISNIFLVRAFGARAQERDRLSRQIGQELSAQRASLRSLERLRLFHAISVFFVVAGVLAWAVALWQDGDVSTGGVVLTTTMGFGVLYASRDFTLSMVELVQHFAKLREAVHSLCTAHEMRDAPDARPLVCLGGSISFDAVSFSYPDGSEVLQDFRLQIAAGEKVGLVGRSGAGKSTVFALLQRHYDPQNGRVLIDGQDISHVTQESLRRSIAIVQQDISLFHRSIIDNLRYGRPDATDDDVRRAAEAAGCLEFIERLPHQFDTIVGQRGLKLSGGQRQRLAIARAFLLDAPIILLDEATSSLDSKSEQSVHDALMSLIEGRTVIAIAHRLSTVGSFDRIIALDGGGIIEEGAPHELLKREGVYRRMYDQQFSRLHSSPTLLF